MKNTLIWLFAATLFIACKNNSSDSSSTSSSIELKNEYSDADFSIRYPEDWTQIPPPAGTKVAFTSPSSGVTDDLAENVNVVFEAGDMSQLNLNQYYEANQRIVAQYFDGYKEVSKKNVKVNGIDGIQLTYTANSDRTEILLSQIYLIHKKKGYVLTYTTTPESHDKYGETCNAILNSFKLK